MKSFSKILITIGVILLIFAAYLVVQRYSPKHLSFDNYMSEATISSKALPAQIIIPSLKINLPVYPAQIKGNSWEATDKGVSYLVSSPVPGDYGNSILYGHNWASLLGPIVTIKPGARLEVVMTDHTKKVFVVKFVSVVTPDETHILEASNDTRITLYTCTGFLDSKRFVVTAIKV